MNKLLVSIDGLHVHDLATMDVDEFKEWLWPGVIAKLWTVSVIPRGIEEKLAAVHAWEISLGYGGESVVSHGVMYPWYEVHAYAKNEQEALDKALVMVDKLLAKARKAPCTML